MGRIGFFVEKKHRICVFLFFAAYLCVGLAVFDDYGISWDELRSRSNGIAAAKYVFEGDQTLLTYGDRYYGTAFEIVLVGIERALDLTKNSRATFFMRHLVTFLLFYVSVIFFYFLCVKRFRSWKVGLLGSLFLVLSPRIFAHSFYNSKDIPCLAMFIISMFTLLKFLEKKTLARAVFHALSCAILIDIRIVGIFVPFLTIVFLILDLFLARAEEMADNKDAIVSIPSYLVLVVLFTLFFWPILWTRPLYHFIEAFKEMSRYRWPNDVLYLGHYIPAKDLPWHYIPVWILISTPIFYTFCFFVGCFSSLYSFSRKPRRFYLTRRVDLISLFWFFLPLVGVITLKSILYDGWRQMFFIYPGFLILSLTGLISISQCIEERFEGRRLGVLNLILVSVAAISLVNTARIMIRYHPFQNVYFNRLAGRDMKAVKQNFELDYWGLSYRKALEYILRHDKDRRIKVYVANLPGRFNAYILKPEDRKRLIYVDRPYEARYYLSNYRWHRSEYSYENECYSIKIGGAKIMVVYRF